MVAHAMCVLYWVDGDMTDPGMMGGQAIAEAIFGVVAPSGRLPYSIRE